MDVEQQQSPIDLSPRGSISVWRCCCIFARGFFNLIVVVAFVGLVGGAIWLFYNGYPWLVATTTLAVFMIAAFCAGTSFRERMVLSLCMPFAAFGGYLGFQIYFALFNFSWFESIFNSKDSGPLGLILFVCGFAVSTAFSAAWLMDFASSRVWPFALRANHVEHPDELAPSQRSQIP